MNFNKSGQNTDQLARSLIQKAIRRNQPDIADATFQYLAKKPTELKWLRARLAVWTFEEAWPYGCKVSFGTNETENRDHIRALCSVIKNKDAAGLGSLAYALSEGDQSVLDGGEDDWLIHNVAWALEGTQYKDYRQRLLAQSETKTRDQKDLVENAIKGSKRAGWPWDKAFAYAAGLLAVDDVVPKLNEIAIETDEPFPFWIAIDKHTQLGKETIKRVAKEMSIDANTALWLSFYFESAVCSELSYSPWWEREKAWRMSKLGIDLEHALMTWVTMRPMVEDYLAIEAEELRQRVMESPRVLNLF
jgi:hypothetical protein